MPGEKATVDGFLENAGMHPESIDLDRTVNLFFDEMTRGLEGKKSSLEMIPTFIDDSGEIPRGRRVVVVDAGGTNLRAALVSFDKEGKPRIEDFSKHPMPGSTSEVSSDEFFAGLASHVRPLVNKGDRIGFCFSYPTEMGPDKDGRLIFWTKEVKAPEVIGKKIGAELRNALTESGVTDPPGVVILNDTVATLLTGKASMGHRRWGGYVGFILGTGTNCCYAESNTAITKIDGLDPQGRQIINEESGSFAVRPRGVADMEMDTFTTRPDKGHLEKMVSGGYFGALAGETIALAIRRGIFSPGGADSLAAVSGLETKDADNYAHNPDDASNPLVAAVRKGGSARDGERLWYLMDSLLERAARLTVANMASAILKGGGGKSPLEPVCLTVDGTTYYAYYRFRDRVEALLRPFLLSRGCHYETARVEEAPLIGAAVAALTN